MTNTLSNKVVDTQEITDELIAGLGRGEIWAQGKAMDILSALRTTHSPSEAEVGERIERWRKASIALGAWMSAALDDPKVCASMKADINEWFSAGEPFAALSRTPDREPFDRKAVLEEAAKAIAERGWDGSPGYKWANISEAERDEYREDARAALARIDSHLGEMK